LHTFVLMLHVNRASDHQTWKVVVVVVVGAALFDSSRGGTSPCRGPDSSTIRPEMLTFR